MTKRPNKSKTRRALRVAVATRLSEAVIAGRLKVEDIAARVARSTGTVQAWLDGDYLPPASVAPVLDDLIKAPVA